MLTPMSSSESLNAGWSWGPPRHLQNRIVVRVRHEASSIINVCLTKGYAGAVTSVVAPFSTGTIHLIFLR